MDSMLECRNLSFSYEAGKKPLLDNISFSITNGQLLTLLGPNGVGKSTLLNCLCGLLKPLSGQILLQGRDIAKMSRRDIANVIAYVPQKISVSFDYSAVDYVVMGRTAQLNIFQTPGRDDYEAAERFMDKLGILPLKNRSVGALSGGEQQKLSIARALIQNPSLIILDEPTSALDYGNQIRVLRLIKELSTDGYSVLLTSHNPDQCLLLQSDVAVLAPDGNLTLGSCMEMLSEELLQNIYGVPIRLTFAEEFGRMVCLPLKL